MWKKEYRQGLFQWQTLWFFHVNAILDISTNRIYTISTIIITLQGDVDV
jgi:hypothetical protein